METCFLKGAHFIYFKKERQLLIERNRYAPFTSVLQSYLEVKTSEADVTPIDSSYFRPVVSGDKLEEFLRSSGPATKIELDIHEDVLPEVEAFDGRLADAFQAQKEVFPESSQIGIRVQIEKYQKQGGMIEAKEKMVEFIRSVPLTGARARVKTIVSGENKSYTINLLSEDIAHTVVVPVDERQHINSEKMWALMLTSYNPNKRIIGE